MIRVYIVENICERRVVEYDHLIHYLKANGVSIVSNVSSADYVIFFACGMKEDHTKSLVRQLSRDCSNIIVYGCAPKMLDLGPESTAEMTIINLYEEDKLDRLFGWRVLYREVQVAPPPVPSKEKTTRFQDALGFWDPRILMPRCYDVKSILISKGCSNNCSYCAIHRATGRLVSRSPEEIRSSVEAALAIGYRAFRLQCENSGAYGQDIGSNLGILLDTLGEITTPFSVDLPDLHPRGMVDYFDSILSFAQRKDIYLIHLPIQSASQRVLDRMNRHYSIRKLAECLDIFTRQHPKIPIGSDVIIGFPGETEEDFEKTLAFLERYSFRPLYLHGYCEKPGTIAADYQDKVPQNVIADRIRRLYTLFPYAACYLNNYHEE